MDGLILAGGAPAPDDPLFAYTQGQPKALLRVNGRSLIDHTLAAMQAASQIDDILVVGLTAEQLNSHFPNVHTMPDQGSLVANGIAGLRWLKAYRQRAAHVAVCSVDIPLITAEIIDQTIANCAPFDHIVYYHFVSRQVMEMRFPHSARTFVKLKGVEIAGADFMIANTWLAEHHEALWEALVNGRKHAWQLARVVGLPFLVKFLFRQIGIPEIEANATRILGKPIRVNLSPFAEIGMDIDKPEHVEAVELEV